MQCHIETQLASTVSKTAAGEAACDEYGALLCGWQLPCLRRSGPAPCFNWWNCMIEHHGCCDSFWMYISHVHIACRVYIVIGAPTSIEGAFANIHVKYSADIELSNRAGVGGHSWSMVIPTWMLCMF